jgi:hypothetical protein
MSNSTLVSSVDNEVGNLEQAVADILDLPVNTDITKAILGPRYASIADETITNQTTLTNFAKKHTIPANTLKVGSVIRVVAWGHWVNAVTDHLALAFYLGVSPNRLLLTISGSPAGFADVAPDARSWRGESDAIIRTIGAAGTYVFGSQAQDGSASFSASGVAVATNSDYGNVDTTVDRDVLVAASIGPTANAGNSILLLGLTVEIFKAQSTS